jgi:TPR repeat protein
MTLVRLKSVTCFAIPLMLAFASSDAAMASPFQAGQRVYVDGLDMPVELPVVFPPVKKIVPKPPKPTEQELRTRAETGDVDAMLAYGEFLSTPSDFPWYLKAAEAGSPKAMMIVANRAKNGDTGHGKDLALSEKWLNKAIQTGSQALSRKDIRLLKLLLDGDQSGGGAGLLGAPTKEQYASAIGRAGGFEIEDIFGSVIHVFPNTPEKVQLLEKCSNGGHPWCTEQLANGYLNGDNGLIIDHGLGIKLLTKVAQAGYNIGPAGVHSDVAGAPDYPGSNLVSQTERIQLWKIAIEHGDLSYAIDLAGAYRNGDGVQKSASIAAALLQTLIRRSDTDDARSTKGMVVWKLASMYVDGKSLPLNDQSFLSLLNLASSLDNDGRQEIKECLLYCGEGLLRGDTLNMTEATRLLLLKSVAEKGPPFYDAPNTDDQYESALRLGDLYSSGQKMNQSYADAMTWYKKAEQIATGSPEMRFHYDGDSVSASDGLVYDGGPAIKIGTLYEKGLGVPKDDRIAMSWYRQAADNLISRSGSPAYMLKLLNSVQLPKETTDRLIFSIRSSAEADNHEAQYYLAEMYYEGKYMPQSYSEAAAWFEKCGSVREDNGQRGSCLNALGKMYLQGQGVTRDPAKAAQYFQRSVDGSSFIPSSVFDILLPMYCGGEGISTDRPKAFNLFKINADQNITFDALGLGAMYQMGWGTEQDLAEAFNWYRKAAADKNYSSAKAKADFTRIFRDCKGTPDNFNAAVSLYDKASGGQH